MVTYYMTKAAREKIRKEADVLLKKAKSLESRMQDTAEVAGDGWHDNPSLYASIADADLQFQRVNEFAQILANSRIIEYPLVVDKVCLGSRVTLKRVMGIEIYDIVGYGDDDLDKNCLLYTAPLIQAIMNKKVGDHAIFQLDGKKEDIEISNVTPLIS